MQSRIVIALKVIIPRSAEQPSHPCVSPDRRTAGARSEGHEPRPNLIRALPSAGASPTPLTAAGTLPARWRRGDGARHRYVALLLTGSLLLCTEPSTAAAQSAPTVRPTVGDPYAAPIAEASRRFGIPERWIQAVLHAESAGDMRAISPKGAIGLMQLMPDTWAELRARHRLGRDPSDLHDNILAGTAYLREMWDRYGTIPAMLAAYNAGPERYDQHRSTGRPLPAETRAYVAALLPAVSGTAAPGAPDRASAPPPDWRDAPLFARRPDGIRMAASGQTIGTPGDTRAALPARDRRIAEPQVGSLFVARASNGGSP